MYLFSSYNFRLDNKSGGTSSEKNNDVSVFPIETTKKYPYRNTGIPYDVETGIEYKYSTNYSMNPLDQANLAYEHEKTWQQNHCSAFSPVNNTLYL